MMKSRSSAKLFPLLFALAIGLILAMAMRHHYNSKQAKTDFEIPIESQGESMAEMYRYVQENHFKDKRKYIGSAEALKKVYAESPEARYRGYFSADALPEKFRSQFTGLNQPMLAADKYRIVVLGDDGDPSKPVAYIVEPGAVMRRLDLKIQD